MFFLFDHSAAEREDPVRILAILEELYGLQQAFFSRRQKEGETLQEFSLALMGKVKQCAPTAMPNAETLLRDQFVKHVFNCSLQLELKQLVRQEPNSTLLDVRAEAGKGKGLPGGARGRG